MHRLDAGIIDKGYMDPFVVGSGDRGPYLLGGGVVGYYTMLHIPRAILCSQSVKKIL